MVLGHSDNIDLSATNIILGGASAGITSMLIKYGTPKIKKLSRKKEGVTLQHWSFLTLVDATLCGMVALCSGCNIIPTYG
jgi:Amt family ammonium transporter